VAKTNVNDNAQPTTKIRRAFICSLVILSGWRGGGIIGICRPVFENCQGWPCPRLLSFLRAKPCFWCVSLGS
jgi:hypothetical protein